MPCNPANGSLTPLPKGSPHPPPPLHPTLRFGGKKLYLFQAFYDREWNTKHLKTDNVCSKNW